MHDLLGLILITSIVYTYGSACFDSLGKVSLMELASDGFLLLIMVYSTQTQA